MNEEIQTSPELTLWVDHTNRIISFRRAAGFEAKTFLSQSLKIAYAFEMSSSGYRIQ